MSTSSATACSGIGPLLANCGMLSHLNAQGPGGENTKFHMRIACQLLFHSLVLSIATKRHHQGLHKMWHTVYQDPCAFDCNHIQLKGPGIGRNASCASELLHFETLPS